MKIANFTPEAIEWTHEGITGIIQPGEVKDFPDNRAKFILSKMDRRGLVQMELGDDKDNCKLKREESMKRYIDFWQYNVISFNQNNETRKMENKHYLKAPKHIAKHAEELGIDLVGPWTIKANKSDDPGAIGALQKQIDQLTTIVTALLTGKMAGEAISGIPAETANAAVEDNIPPAQVFDSEETFKGIAFPDSKVTVQPETDWNDVYNSFKFVPKTKLESYFQENKELIKGWPPDILTKFIERYEKAYGRSPDLT